MQGTTRTRKQNFFLILTLGILNALTPFSIDMYLPAFPEIATDLGATVAQVALTVSTYFIGFGLGQIVYGPLLDRFGRKAPIVGGLSLYLLASIGCMNASSVEMLLGFRFLSALGGCAASVGAITYVRDLFPPHQGTRVFSMLMLVLSVSPLLAPTAGSFLLSVADWRVIFAILSGVALLDVLLVIWVLPKGAMPDGSVILKPKELFAGFKRVFMVPQFATYTLAGSLSFAGLFVYVAGSPAIFMEGFHVDAKTFGMIFAFLSVGMIGGGQLNLLFLKKFKEKDIFRAALTVQTTLGLIFFVGSLLGLYGMYSTIAFLFFILGCCGVTYPNAASLALMPFTKNVGTASSLLGFIQLSVGALVSALVGLLDVKGALPTAGAICFSTCIGLTLLMVITIKTKKKKH